MGNFGITLVDMNVLEEEKYMESGFDLRIDYLGVSASHQLIDYKFCLSYLVSSR